MDDVTIITTKVKTAGNCLLHGYTMRDGGSSLGPYESLNLGLHVGDEPETVMANRRTVSRAVGIPLESFVFCEQVHGGDVAVVGATDRGRGTTPDRPPVAGVDGLVTAEPGVALGVFTADCAPVYLIDREHRAVGLVHAGWRGTAARIVARAIETMHTEFATDPGRLTAAVGPSIGPGCYQVGDDVRDSVTAAEPALAAVFEPSGDGRWQFDLKRANRLIAEQSGVPRDAVHISDICTACDRRFFSYRRDGPTTGRTLQFIAIRV